MKTLMLAAIRYSLMFTAVAALSLAYPASVQAVPTTYRYTGNHFTFATGPYTTSMFVTVMLTLADPLPANFDGTVTPTAFTVTDGVQTISNHNAIGVEFQFATDATSIITQWHVGVALDDFPNIDTFNLPDIIEDDGVDENLDSGGNNDSPGVWSVNASVPDGGVYPIIDELIIAALGHGRRRWVSPAQALARPDRARFQFQKRRRPLRTHNETLSVVAVASGNLVPTQRSCWKHNQKNIEFWDDWGSLFYDSSDLDVCADYWALPVKFDRRNFRIRSNLGLRKHLSPQRSLLFRAAVAASLLPSTR
jgi:hypothetical protein